MKSRHLVKNTSTKPQSIVAIGMFQPGETREVSNNNLKRLLRNPNFVEVNAEPKAEPKKPARKE